MSFYEEIAGSAKPHDPLANNPLVVGRAAYAAYSGDTQGDVDRILSINMIARENAGYNKAIDDALRVFAEFEPHMHLNIDIRNDFCDKIGSLKKK